MQMRQETQKKYELQIPKFLVSACIYILYNLLFIKKIVLLYFVTLATSWWRIVAYFSFWISNLQSGNWNRSRRVAQLVSELPSVLVLPSSILSDSNVCSDFSLICLAVALNTRKMEHWQREGVKDTPSASIDNSSMNWRNYRR